jgi:hypothetical protein
LNSVETAFLAIGNPADYIASLGKNPYKWQRMVMDPAYRRVIVLAPRQSGKSLISSGEGGHKAVHKDKSLVVIIAPTEKQTIETAKKVKDFLREDPKVKVIRSSDTLVVLENESRIINVVANENGPRGFSSPDVIVIDEASRVPDEVYFATRPQLVKNPNAKLIIVSTPFGKQGFFYRAWASEKSTWTKILVTVPFKLERTAEGLKVVSTDIPEEEYQAYWAERGINAFYSPHHTQAFLQEELDEMGEWWWRQEYGVEFLDSQENLFDSEDIRAAVRWRYTGSV